MKLFDYTATWPCGCKETRGSEAAIVRAVRKHGPAVTLSCDECRWKVSVCTVDAARAAMAEHDGCHDLEIATDAAIARARAAATPPPPLRPVDDGVGGILGAMSRTPPGGPTAGQGARGGAGATVAPQDLGTTQGGAHGVPQAVRLALA